MQALGENDVPLFTAQTCHCDSKGDHEGTIGRRQSQIAEIENRTIQDRAAEKDEGSKGSNPRMFPLDSSGRRELLWNI